jgi:hypothetical protein
MSMTRDEFAVLRDRITKAEGERLLKAPRESPGRQRPTRPIDCRGTVATARRSKRGREGSDRQVEVDGGGERTGPYVAAVKLRAAAEPERIEHEPGARSRWVKPALMLRAAGDNHRRGVEVRIAR